jgi:hypothetical protein
VIFRVVGLLLLLGFVGCGSDVNDDSLDIEREIDQSALVGVAGNNYYRVRRDTRTCAFPVCGGFWIHPLNHTLMTCQDGRRKSECYIEKIIKPQTLGARAAQADERLALPPELLARGIITSQYDPELGRVSVMRLTEVWHMVVRLGRPKMTTEKYFSLVNSGLICADDPCFSIVEARLNSGVEKELSGIAGSDALVKTAYSEMADGTSIIVIGKNEPSQGPWTTGKDVRISSIYKRAFDNHDPCATVDCLPPLECVARDGRPSCELPQ